MLTYVEEEKVIQEKIKSLELKRVNEKGLTETLSDFPNSFKLDILHMHNLVLNNISHLNRSPHIEVLEHNPLSTDKVKVAKVRSYYEEAGDGFIKYGIFFIDRKTNKLLNKLGVMCWTYNEDYDEYDLDEARYYKYR